MAVDTQYALNTMMFLMVNDEIRTSKIERIVIDKNGQNYLFMVNGEYIERPANKIAKTKEDLFNNLVTAFIARQTK